MTGRVGEDLEHLDVVGRDRRRVDGLADQQLELPGGAEVRRAARARVDHAAVLDQLVVVEQRLLARPGVEAREIGRGVGRHVPHQEAQHPRRIRGRGILEELVGVEEELLRGADPVPSRRGEPVRPTFEEDHVARVGPEPRVAAIPCVGQRGNEGHAVPVHDVGAHGAREVRIAAGLDGLDLQTLEEVLQLGDGPREPEGQNPVAREAVLPALQELDEPKGSCAVAAPPGARGEPRGCADDE
jgi:hypothetical protein